MTDRVLAAVEDARDEIVGLAADLIRIPSVNPPGRHYAECAALLEQRLRAMDYGIETVTAPSRPEHDESCPRINLVARREHGAARPVLHFNGHVDVVPPGRDWTQDPFGGVVHDGRLYGRGAADMKAGLAAAVFAAEAVRRAGVPLRGAIEISATVDEESGGHAGVGHLAEIGRVGADRTDWVIIPEPLDPDQICVGHRGVWWFRIVVDGAMAHGSMPFQGINAIEKAAALTERLTTEVGGQLATRRTAMPVVPEEARRPTLNVNSIRGGQPAGAGQTPCVADRCEVTFDRRFLREEGLEMARAEVEAVLSAAAAADPELTVRLDDLLTVEPVQAPDDSPLIAALEAGIERVYGRAAARVASPGTYDQKHFARIGGIEHCVAYGPGRLEQAHRADEHCEIDDLVAATKVMALAVAELLGD